MDDKDTTRHVHKAIASRLASYKLDDNAVSGIVRRIVKEGLKIKRIDFCPYGICIDYFGDERIRIDKLFDSDKFRVIRLFPYGIPVDDLFHLKIEMEIPELGGGQVRG